MEKYFLKNMLWYLLELSQQDNSNKYYSNEYPQHVFVEN